jgi:hypothetical protein
MRVDGGGLRPRQRGPGVGHHQNKGKLKMVCIAQIPDGRWEVGYHFEGEEFSVRRLRLFDDLIDAERYVHYLNGGDWNHPELD